MGSRNVKLVVRNLELRASILLGSRTERYETRIFQHKRKKMKFGFMLICRRKVVAKSLDDVEEALMDPNVEAVRRCHPCPPRLFSSPCLSVSFFQKNSSVLGLSSSLPLAASSFLRLSFSASSSLACSNGFENLCLSLPLSVRLFFHPSVSPCHRQSNSLCLSLSVSIPFQTLPPYFTVPIY